MPDAFTQKKFLIVTIGQGPVKQKEIVIPNAKCILVNRNSRCTDLGLRKEGVLCRQGMPRADGVNQAL